MAEIIGIDHSKRLEAAGESATEAEDHATLIRACLGPEIAADQDLTINIVKGLRNETLARATLAYVEARGGDGEADSRMLVEQQRILEEERRKVDRHEAHSPYAIGRASLLTNRDRLIEHMTSPKNEAGQPAIPQLRQLQFVNALSRALTSLREQRPRVVSAA